MIDREKVAKAVWNAGRSAALDAEEAFTIADAAIAAVLEQLREPTPAMLESFGIHKGRMRLNWQAMLDAATK